MDMDIKTLVQCDFDGTITEEDVSYFILDTFAQGDWRELLGKYKGHRISVDEFNTKAFAMVKADESTLLAALKDKVRVRAGLREMVDYCLWRGFRLVIVSNGLCFYIEAILSRCGLENIEVYAGQSWFHSQGMEVKYLGPDGKQLPGGLKETYICSFLNQGYRIIYIGNGDSDIVPASYAYQILATGELLAYCRENGLSCRSFGDLHDVVEILELL